MIGDFVEFLFEIRREVVLHIAGEEAFEEGGQQTALVLGNEALLLDAHIVAFTQHRQRRSIGGGATDAQFFHALDQRRLGEARRRLGEMLDGLYALLGERVACGHGGQAAAFLIVLVVLAFLIELQEAVEAHDLAGGAQLELANGGGGAHIRRNLHRGALQLGGFHLAGDGAGPDQVIEGELVGLQISGHLLGQPRGVGGAHGFMGLLRILLLGRIGAGRLGHIGGAVLPGDDLAGPGHRLGRHVDAVGTHICNETHGLAAEVNAFIEALGELHGAGGGEAQLAGGFLLQGRGGEGRGRVALCGLGLH